MTATNEMVRERMARELDGLGPMPDLVPRVVAEGGRVVRRRRLAVTSGVAAAALATGWGAGRLADGGSGSGPAATDPAASSTGGASSVPTSVPVVSDGEYTEAIATTLGTVLADRLVGVQRIDPDGTMVLRMRDGSPGIRAGFSVRGRLPGLQPIDCAAHDTADSCAQVRFGGGWLAVASHHTDDGGTEFASLILQRGSVEATLDLLPIGSGIVLSRITDAELLAAAQHPAFLDLVRLGVEHAAGRPSDDMVLRAPGEPTQGPEPEWPGE